MPLSVGKTKERDGTLSIRNLSPSDSGLYECVAISTMGTKKVTMNLVVQRTAGNVRNFKLYRIGLRCIF